MPTMYRSNLSMRRAARPITHSPRSSTRLHTSGRARSGIRELHQARGTDEAQKETDSERSPTHDDTPSLSTERLENMGFEGTHHPELRFTVQPIRRRSQAARRTPACRNRGAPCSGCGTGRISGHRCSNCPNPATSSPQSRRNLKASSRFLTVRSLLFTFSVWLVDACRDSTRSSSSTMFSTSCNASTSASRQLRQQRLRVHAGRACRSLR